MAKKFNLAELMGETVSNLNTENAKEQEIPLADIEENAANIYAQTDIEELAESIKVAGLMQPLVVWRLSAARRASPPQRNRAAWLEYRSVSRAG